jgi:DNA-binding LacI/PurR family transcriptional regulator
LLVSNDLLFSTVKTAISELGIGVPRDLRVVTHSNKGLSAPELFPVAQLEMDPDAYALQLAQMMQDLLSRKEPACKQATARAMLLPEHQCAVLA